LAVGIGWHADCYIDANLLFSPSAPVSRSQAKLAPQTSSSARRISDILRWRSSYDGIMVVAEYENRTVAGISGPWAGKFALTWWTDDAETRALKLFDSITAAKREVELWARGKSGLPLFETPPTKRGGILGFLLPGFSRSTSDPERVAHIDRLRRSQNEVHVDLRAMHFHALD
jgi:hypothetical protein